MSLSCTVPDLLQTSPPQSHFGRARRYPHVGECTLLLRVLAVACTMRIEALRDVMGALRCVTGRYGSVTKLLQNFTEPLRKRSILPITNRILNFAHH